MNDLLTTFLAIIGGNVVGFALGWVCYDFFKYLRSKISSKKGK